MRRTHRHKTIFYREIRAICCWSYRWAYPWIAITLLLCIPAFMGCMPQVCHSMAEMLPSPSASMRLNSSCRPAAASLPVILPSLLESTTGNGPGQLIWDGKDDRGRPVASGIYVVRLSGSRGAVTGRVTRLR